MSIVTSIKFLNTNETYIIKNEITKFTIEAIIPIFFVLSGFDNEKIAQINNNINAMI